MERNYEKCIQCTKWHWTNEHCADEYQVYHEDYNGDEPISVRGYGFNDAAETYATDYNSEGDLMNETATIKIVKGGTVKWFSIGAEPSVHYTTDEISKP